MTNPESQNASPMTFQVSQEKRVRVRGNDLEPGQYFIIVDQLAAEQFDGGEFGLDLSIQVHDQF